MTIQREKGDIAAALVQIWFVRRYLLCASVHRGWLYLYK